MKEQTRYMLIMAAIPWLVFLYFGMELLAAGLLTKAFLVAVAVSLINGLVGKRVGQTNEQ